MRTISLLPHNVEIPITVCNGATEYLCHSFPLPQCLFATVYLWHSLSVAWWHVVYPCHCVSLPQCLIRDNLELWSWYTFGFRMVIKELLHNVLENMFRNKVNIFYVCFCFARMKKPMLFVERVSYTLEVCKL